MWRLALLIAACGREGGEASGTSRVSDHPYFAGATWVGLGDATRYAAALQAMGEPAIGTGGGTMRLLWLRTFHRPMAIRLTTTDSTCRVVFTVLEGKGGPPFGEVRKRDSSSTNASRCQEVRESLQHAAFWDDTLAAGKVGRDGADWVFEVRDAAAYRVVVRWSPEVSKDPRYAVAGRAFLRLASFDEAADDPIY